MSDKKIYIVVVVEKKHEEDFVVDYVRAFSNLTNATSYLYDIYDFTKRKHENHTFVTDDIAFVNDDEGQCESFYLSQKEGEYWCSGRVEEHEIY